MAVDLLVATDPLVLNLAKRGHTIKHVQVHLPLYVCVLSASLLVSS